MPSPALSQVICCHSYDDTWRGNTVLGYEYQVLETILCTKYHLYFGVIDRIDLEVGNVIAISHYMLLLAVYSSDDI